MSKPIAGAETRVAESVCIHCGAPVRGERRGSEVPEGGVASDDSRFCCGGCEAAYQLLHQAGLDDFYRYRQRESVAGGATSRVGEEFEEFDDPAFQEEFVTVLSEDRWSVELILSGLHCRACVWLLEQLGRLEPAIKQSRLNLHRSVLTVVWDPREATLSSIAGMLAKLGYQPHAAKENEGQRRAKLEQRQRLVQIAIAAAVTGNLMIVSVALYAGWFSGMSGEMRQLFRYVSTLLGLVVVLGPGRVFFRQAWFGLKMRVPNMDMPIATGLGLGTIVGVVNTFRGTGEIYFDSLAMLVLLLLVGRWIQSRQHGQAAEMIQRLYELTPRRARRIQADGVARWVAVRGLKPGETIEVLAGETMPADGTIVAGDSSLDRSLLTGESLPIRVRVGDAVHSGMINLDSAVRIEVTAVGETSRLGKLIQLIEGAAIQRTPLVQFADRLGGVFVVVILVLTVLTAVGWTWLGSSEALDHAIALAIVACPCALGLATPLAVAVAIGRAAREQILIKGGDTLERLSRPGLLWLDKTGTLTEGRLRVCDWRGSPELRRVVVELERHSSHPVARAIAQGLGGDDANGGTESGSEASESWGGLESSTICQSPLGGIRGRWQGRWITVGSGGYLEQQGVEIDPSWRVWAQECGGRGETPILVADAGVVAAGVALGDRLREDSLRVVQTLRRQGWQVGILSGDHPNVVQAVAGRLQIPAEMAHGGLLPEDKLLYLDRERAGFRGAGPVVMVGDGMNDAAALAAADVGVSMKASAETSLASADVHLGREGLVGILELVDGARRTLRTVHTALGASLAYNLVAVALAMLGWINPLVAAVLMPLSSLTVVTLAIAGRGFRRFEVVAGSWGGEDIECKVGVESFVTGEEAGRDVGELRV